MSLSFHVEAAGRFDAQAESIVSQLADLPAAEASPSSPFPEPYLAAEITADDMVAPPVVFHHSSDGRRIALHFTGRDGRGRALAGDGYEAFERLISAIHRLSAWQKAVARESLADEMIAWLMSSTGTEHVANLCSHLETWANAAVRVQEVIIPLHGFRIAAPFRVGPALVRSITGDEVVGWFAAMERRSPEDGSFHKDVITRWQRRVQGSPGAVVTVEAESARAVEVARAMAEDVAMLIRLFAPEIVSPSSRSYIAVLGRHRLDTDYSIVIPSGGTPGPREGMVVEGHLTVGFDQNVIARIAAAGLDALGALLEDRPLSEFEQRLLTALRIYSRVALEAGLTEKVVHAIVALETILGRDATEAIQENVALRAAFVVARTAKARMRVVEIVKHAYAARSAFVHRGASAAISGDIVEFFQVVRQLFLRLTQLKGTHQTREQLFDAIDEMKFT